MGALLLLVMLVLAPVAVGMSSARLKTVGQIVLGMVAGIGTGIAIGAALGSAVLAGNLAFELMFCGGIWVSVRKIRRARRARAAPSA